MFFSLITARRALTALTLAATSCAALANTAIHAEPPRPLGLGDIFLWNQAHVLRGCIDDRSCQLSLEHYDTPSPRLAFVVQASVFEKFRDADRLMYLRGAGHILLKLHERPTKALTDSKYGGAGLTVDSQGFEQYTENVRTGLRSVRFVVVDAPLGDKPVDLKVIEPGAQRQLPELNYKWDSVRPDERTTPTV